MRIGITGHMDIAGKTAEVVVAALRAHLAGVDPAALVGVSCLAPGADTLFAEAVVELGGRLRVLIPSADYRRTQVSAADAGRFDAAVAAAESVTVLPFETAGPQAYEAANHEMLDMVDELVAVWDGKPAPDGGGTGGAVAEARRRGVPVVVVWPDGAVRAGASGEAP